MATEMGSKLENVLDRICNVLQDLHETQRNSTGTGNAIPKRKVHFHSYDETNETMENFIDRLENYLERKEIAEDKEKVGMLLELIPPSVFQTLTNLTVPEKPKAKTYDVLINLLRTHLSPKPNVFAQQHRFAVRIQNEGESIMKFIEELKRLSINCSFTCTDCGKSTIETHLRTQFIRGLRDDDIRQELLRLKEDTKFDEIVREATAINTSKIETKKSEVRANFCSRLC
uniref:Retrotransposon gag domain-containing protein n=1 Tax=Photinus pyralis TaxID=7054 RepID=A0A1Y1M1C4_PHOPY